MRDYNMTLGKTFSLTITECSIQEIIQEVFNLFES